MGDAGVELLARALRVNYWLTALYLQVSIRQHTSAYVTAYVSIRAHTSAYVRVNYWLTALYLHVLNT